MAMPDFPSLRLVGRHTGDIMVFADEKYLGVLFYDGGEFCVRLAPQVVKTIGKKAVEE